jgi:hypothetical protein
LRRGQGTVHGASKATVHDRGVSLPYVSETSTHTKCYGKTREREREIHHPSVTQARTTFLSSFSPSKNAQLPVVLESLVLCGVVFQMCWCTMHTLPCTGPLRCLLACFLLVVADFKMHISGGSRQSQGLSNDLSRGYSNHSTATVTCNVHSFRFRLLCAGVEAVKIPAVHHT